MDQQGSSSATISCYMIILYLWINKEAVVLQLAAMIMYTVSMDQQGSSSATISCYDYTVSMDQQGSSSATISCYDCSMCNFSAPLR